ncbi:MAG: hypothetical protein ABI131_02430 [Nostocoides sp.]
MATNLPRGERSPAESIGDLSLTIDREFSLLEQRRAALLDMRSSVHQLRSLLPADTGVGGGTELIPGEQASAEVERLMELSGGPFHSVTLTVEEGPGVDDVIYRATQQQMAADMVQQTLYSTQVAESASGRRWMAMYAKIGEEQRISIHPPTEFGVFGSYAVIATAVWGDVHSGYVLIRNPMLVAAFGALFDAAYAVGLPVDRPGDDSGAEIQLLELLALGMKDEAIARYLGWGLRTVRRRIARQMDVHGVDTRYQLGAAVTAAGLIDPQGSAPRPNRARSR